APAGLVRSTIRFEPAREPARHEWFIAGTEQAVIRTAASKALAGIAYPANGSVIALDPDIPPSRQRVPLRLSAPTSAGWVWRIDGKTLGKATARTFWLPQPGRHQLSLENARGEIIDSVIFDVRALKARLR
ncbi:MAG: penicillin-binding protein 1C, partial [Azonexus sp.]